MDFRLVPESVTLNGVMTATCAVSVVAALLVL